MAATVDTKVNWYWLTYPHRWGSGKVHLRSCRFADDNETTGHWVHIDRLPPDTLVENCKVCGGRKPKLRHTRVVTVECSCGGPWPCDQN